MTIGTEIPGASKGDEGVEGSGSPQARGDADSSSSSSCSSAESEGSEPESPGAKSRACKTDAVDSLVVNLSTGRFHRARVAGRGFAPERGRRSNNVTVITREEIGAFLLSDNSVHVACELCFPSRTKGGETCKAICGFAVGSGFCGLRCAHQVSEDRCLCGAEHACELHSLSAPVGVDFEEGYLFL